MPVYGGQGSKWTPGTTFGDDGPGVSYQIADPNDPDFQRRLEKEYGPGGGGPDGGDGGGDDGDEGGGWRDTRLGRMFSRRGGGDQQGGQQGGQQGAGGGWGAPSNGGGWR